MQACYASWRGFWGGETPEDRARWQSSSEFAVSESMLAFTVILSDGETGLLVVDRESGKQRLIYERGFGFWAPHLTVDGERLMMIKRERETARRQILSCQVDFWRCDVYLRTENNLRSPVEIEKDTILYSSTPLRIGEDGRHWYADYDIHLLQKGGVPKRLSDFGLYELGSISVANGKIYFAGEGPKRENPVIPRPSAKRVTDERSKVFAVNFDIEKQQISKPDAMLKPLFVLDGFTIGARISQDGRKAAVHNAQYGRGRGRYIYENVVVDLVSGTQRRLKTEAIIASRGVFVGNALVYSELFPDHYKIQEYDLNSGALREILEINHSQERLRTLERIELTLQN